jgi:glycosyltransferase involved in cell wall biosynthesis
MIPFSVLMSVYYKERPNYLRMSLGSVFAQSRKANEVILVEDGPLGVELEEVVREFENKELSLKVIRLSKNCGLGGALNVGMTKCTFDYVMRMDSDDICFPNRFEKIMLMAEMHPELDVIGSWTQEFKSGPGEKMRLTCIKKFPHTVEDNEAYCRKRCPVEHPAVVLKKEAVLKAGGYQPFYLYEDYYLWARMFVNGCKFYNIQEPLLFFRTSDEAMKRRGGWKYAISEMSALRKFYKIGFLNKRQFAFTVVTRMPVRLLPNRFRIIFYYLFLRK